MGALVSAIVGAVLAWFGMGARYRLSNHWWSARRYDDVGGKALWLFDSLVAMAVAGIIFFRLAWWVASRRGPRWSDRWLLIPLGVLLYLLYVANVEDVSFWPVGIALVGLSLLLARIK